MIGRDDFTATASAAAAFERERAINSGDYDEPWRPTLAECDRDEAEMAGGRRG